MESSKAAAKATASTLNDAVDGVPGVGHAKGAIHYLVGDEIGGDKAMKSASRTVGVIAGGAGGFVVGGPVGAVAGGIAGGAAADAIISGADSAVHKEWRPHGQIAAWDALANAKTDDEIIDGVIGVLVTPAFDALGGIKAGKRFAPKAGKPRPASVAKPNLLRPPKANQALKAGRGSGGPGGPGGPGGARGSGMGERPGLSMTHAEGFHQHFGMSDEQFATFQDQGNGTFIATQGFDFVHAVLTTNDHPTTIAINTATQQPVQASGAGALWQTCTGSPIGSNPCAVSNCTNFNRDCSVHPQHAGATAHVYLTSQTPNHQIEYMVLMPTCCGNNNHLQCHNNNTNFPLGGQEANVLQARPGTPVMFIRIDRNTAGRKGGKGRGKGEGGSFGPPFGHDGGDGNSGAAH